MLTVDDTQDDEADVFKDQEPLEGFGREDDDIVGGETDIGGDDNDAIAGDEE